MPTFNSPSAVGKAANKLSTFTLLKEHGVSHPAWSTSFEDAKRWVESGVKTFCRKLLTGHSGKGIVIASCQEELVDAPLYVQSIQKDKEYRVHVFQGEVIDYQQKKKREGFEGGITGIRNHANGWIYARSDVVLPEEVKNQSIKAIEALGLDFGAVDVCTSLQGGVYVFEVNTAPGLQGTTLDRYVEKFQSLLS